MTGDEKGERADEAEKKALSRRKFLKRAALGVAGVGVLATVPSAIMGGTNQGNVQNAGEEYDPRDSDDLNGLEGGKVTNPVVAYVRNGSGGEIVVMRGAREVILRDPGLAARLVRVARG